LTVGHNINSPQLMQNYKHQTNTAKTACDNLVPSTNLRSSE
jgi:hypothetical protein